MRIALLLIAFILTPNSVLAQTAREDTFRSLGRSLQSIQDQLSRNQSQALAVGSTAILQDSVPVFTTTKPGAASELVLSPNTTVKYLGDEDGFSKIVPTNSDWNKGPIYVEKADLFKKIASRGTNAIEDAITRVGELAKQYNNNQYVRIKGFKLSLSISPSLDVEFELK